MRLLDTILQDARYSIRVLLQNPGFAAVAILSLALGIGANTAIFTLIERCCCAPCRCAIPSGWWFRAQSRQPGFSMNYPDYEYIRDHNRSFSGVIA